MKNFTALAATGIAVATIGALTGCSPTTEKAYTGPPVPPPTVWTGSPAPATMAEGHGSNSHAGETPGEAPAGGANLHQYIVDNKIGEYPITKDEPGTPVVEFPFPADWVPAGDRKPDWAYGAIVYGKPKDPNDPPFLYSIASKLTGNVDPKKILELAAGQLNELPGFKPVDGPPQRDKFAGYDAVNYIGTYVWEGKERAVGQETVVVPGKDGLFVFQLNGEAPAGQEQVVADAADMLRAQTKITVPS